MSSLWLALLDVCHVISILPLMSARIVCPPLYAQCVFTETEAVDMPPGIICILRNGYVCASMVAILCAWGPFLHSPLRSISLLLSPTSSSSLSLTFFCLSLGGFVLTEAVCARHRLCCLEEERRAAESGRERERKTEERAVGKATCLRWKGWGWVMHHLPLDTLPS